MNLRRGDIPSGRDAARAVDVYESTLATAAPTAPRRVSAGLRFGGSRRGVAQVPRLLSFALSSLSLSRLLLRFLLAALALLLLAPRAILPVVDVAAGFQFKYRSRAVTCSVEMAGRAGIDLLPDQNCRNKLGRGFCGRGNCCVHVKKDTAEKSFRRSEWV